jgi:serine protease AprX
MAGLIAGRDSALTAPYAQAPASAYRGMAPDARIVSIKVATADGGADVSQVIAAIDWVVQHRNDNGMNIRVLNLSYGTNSSQWFGVDPLAFAVEQAWNAGIVVVAAAGNSGFQTKGSSPALANPAYDKRIIAVGASDSMGTATVLDDTVPDFSAAAKTGSARAPDFVAPGVHLQGLRVLNSYIDTKVDGKTILDDRFMRGSGTSEAAAIASGAAAEERRVGPAAVRPDRDDGLGRAGARPDPLSAAPHLRPDRRTRNGHRLARRIARIGSPDAGRCGPQGRAGHLRQPVRLDRDGRPRGRRKFMVRRDVERQQLVGQLLVRQQLVG